MLPDAQWRQLRLVAADGTPRTDWRILDQPAGFAELVDAGRVLLVTSGTELHSYSTGNLEPLHDPIELGATPQRMLASNDGHYVLLSFGRQGDYGHEEHLRVVDAISGEWLPAETWLDGPIGRYAFSPDGQWIVALGMPLDVTTVLQRDSLDVVGVFVHDQSEPVGSFDFFEQRLLLLKQRDPNEPNCNTESSLHVWDPVTNIEEQVRVDGQFCRVRRTASGFALLGPQGDVIVRGSEEPLPLPRLITEPVEGKPTFALRPDGKVLARGFRHYVQLHDAETGELIGVPFYADISSMDIIGDLAFVDDGRKLRARSLLGVIMEWDTIEVTGSVAASRFPGDEASAETVTDPGSWPVLTNRPAIPLAQEAPAAAEVPARSIAAPPWTLDLSALYNYGPFANPNLYYFVSTFPGHLPMGVQRMGDMDFDVRGVASLGFIQGVSTPGQSQIECLVLPETRINALHLLTRNGLETPVNAGTVLAELTFRYLDGSIRRAPLQAAIDLKSFGFDDSLVPSVFATFHLMWRAGGGPIHELMAPRVPNPEPDKLIRCVDISWLANSGTLAIYAMSIESPDPVYRPLGPRL